MAEVTILFSKKDGRSILFPHRSLKHVERKLVLKILPQFLCWNPTRARFDLDEYRSGVRSCIITSEGFSLKLAG